MTDLVILHPHWIRDLFENVFYLKLSHIVSKQQKTIEMHSMFSLIPAFFPVCFRLVIGRSAHAIMRITLVVSFVTLVLLLLLLFECAIL